MSLSKLEAGFEKMDKDTASLQIIEMRKSLSEARGNIDPGVYERIIAALDKLEKALEDKYGKTILN